MMNVLPIKYHLKFFFLKRFKVAKGVWLKSKDNLIHMQLIIVQDNTL